jgi:hypothetical protein
MNSLYYYYGSIPAINYEQEEQGYSIYLNTGWKYKNGGCADENAQAIHDFLP